MDNERIDDILQRLGFLERRLDNLADRIERLELRQPNPPQPVVPPTPPPVQSAPSTSKIPGRVPWRYLDDERLPIRQTAGSTQKPEVGTGVKKDTEYMLGAQILPKAGAVMMLLGLTFLVVLAYSRGWITPAMMFAIEVLFCSGFIVLGTVKRDMKEEFGQILTGVGSCGLYLVFAGGHLYYHLYSGETLVALFFLLSLGNLGFSLWRSSRAFLALGLLGGLVTACVLPNMEGDHSVLNAWLHFLVLIPAALIVAKNKWTPMAVWLWLASTFALLPILVYGLPWFDKVGILYASSALCAGAYAWCLDSAERDMWDAFPPFLLWVTGLIGLAIESSRQGAWQYAFFLILFAGMAHAFRHRSATRNSLLLGAVGVPLTLAPLCFPIEQTAGIYAVLSIVCALASWRLNPPVAASAALVEFLFASTTYLQIAGDLTWSTEVALLLLLSGAVLSTGRAMVRGFGQNESYTLATMAVCMPLAGRLGVLVLGTPNIGWRPDFALDVVLISFVYYALALYFRTRWLLALIAFWVTYALALAVYIGAAMALDLPMDLGLLIPLMFAPALSLAKMPDGDSSGATAWTAVLLGALFARLAVVLAVPLLHWSNSEAAIFGSLVYSVGCFLIIWRQRKPELVYAGWALFGLAAFAYLSVWDFALGVNLLMVSGFLAVSVLGGRASAPVVESRKEFAVALGLLGWAVFSRWTSLLFLLAIPSLDSSPALSLGWTIYFFGLMALGFAYRVPQFRYVSFAVLAATLGKIVLIDLATTDAMIRVAVTIVASLVMLAVGYWYVRLNDAAPHTPAP